MKPFYHLDNLGTAMDQMLTCNIRHCNLDEFEPADKLSLAFTVDEAEAFDLTHEIFLRTYVAKALREMVINRRLACSRSPTSREHTAILN